jgi:hypothetical protein
MSSIDRRAFGRTLATGAGAAVLSSAGVGPGLKGQSAAEESGGYQLKNVRSKSLPDGKELEVSVGTPMGSLAAYVRQVETPTTYVILTQILIGDSEKTEIVNGIKGPVTGDRRTDTIEKVTLIHGKTSRVKKTIKVLLANPYEGLDPQAQIDALLKDKAEGRFGN